MFKYVFRKNFKTEKTDVYFHNFRKQKAPDYFDVLSIKNQNETVGSLSNRIKAILKINKNTPMKGYAVKDIKKLKYSWLYRIDQNGYGPKRNFKPLGRDEVVSKYENILINYDHSQHNEDYIIQKIFDKIGASNRYFAEFGAGDGQTISNVAILRYDGWKGLLIEPLNKFFPNIHNAVCIRDFLTPDSIEPVFKKAGAPEAFDFLSVDIDGNDYYLWQALNKYKPRLVCIEVDGYAKDIKKLEPYEKSVDGQKCSIITMTELAEKKGYKLIYNNRGNVFYLNNGDYFKYFKPLKSVKWNEPFAATVNLF